MKVQHFAIKLFVMKVSLFRGHGHPEISLHTYPSHEYMVFINNDNRSAVAELMVSSAIKIIATGTEILICPDNTCHQVYEEVKEKITTTWLHIAEEVSDVAKKSGFKRLRVLVQSISWKIKFIRKNFLHTIWCMKYLVRTNKRYQRYYPEGNGLWRHQQRIKKYFLDVIDGLNSKGCDAVVLGCMEMRLIVLPGESSLPTLDSTRILARAALKNAI